MTPWPGSAAPCSLRACRRGGPACWGASIQALTAAAKPGPYPPDALAHRMPGVLAKLAGRAAGARD
nr:hypothetical protein [Propionibacterium freudenreichii]